MTIEVWQVHALELKAKALMQLARALAAFGTTTEHAKGAGIDNDGSECGDSQMSELYEDRSGDLDTFVESARKILKGNYDG